LELFGFGIARSSGRTRDSAAPLKFAHMEIDFLPCVFITPPDASFRIEHNGQPLERVIALLTDIAAPAPRPGISVGVSRDEIHVAFDGSRASVFAAMSDALVADPDHETRIIAVAVVFDVEIT